MTNTKLIIDQVKKNVTESLKTRIRYNGFVDKLVKTSYWRKICLQKSFQMLSALSDSSYFIYFWASLNLSVEKYFFNYGIIFHFFIENKKNSKLPNLS